MLRLVTPQMDTLASAAQAGFEREMVAHARQFAPRHCAHLDDEVLMGFVRTALQRASDLDFRRRGPMRLYLELMLLFGSDFDSDPALAPVFSGLALGEGDDEMSRADEICGRASRFLDLTAGPEGEYALAAASRFAQQRPEELYLSRDYFERELMGRLQMLHPQHFAVVAPQGLRALVTRAAETARRFPVQGGAGLVLFAQFAFLLGHGFETDPQFPWLQAAWRRYAPETAEPWLHQLLAEAAGYFQSLTEAAA